MNRENDYGTTALYRAAKYNDSKMLETLLDAGADPSVRLRAAANDPGFTAHDAAMKYNGKLGGTAVLARLKDGAAACDGHIVQEGDSRLGIIAEKALGDESRWREITRLNGIDAGNSYQLGQCLALPG